MPLQPSNESAIGNVSNTMTSSITGQNILFDYQNGLANAGALNQNGQYYQDLTPTPTQNYVYDEDAYPENSLDSSEYYQDGDYSENWNGYDQNVLSGNEGNYDSYLTDDYTDNMETYQYDPYGESYPYDVNGENYQYDENEQNYQYDQDEQNYQYDQNENYQYDPNEQNYQYDENYENDQNPELFARENSAEFPNSYIYDESNLNSVAEENPMEVNQYTEPVHDGYQRTPQIEGVFDPAGTYLYGQNIGSIPQTSQPASAATLVP